MDECLSGVARYCDSAVPYVVFDGVVGDDVVVARAEAVGNSICLLHSAQTRLPSIAEYATTSRWMPSLQSPGTFSSALPSR